MSNEILLFIFMIILVVCFVVAYLLRDKSQDEIKSQIFFNSITGGPLSIDKEKRKDN
jgi:hypothetical protein